MAKQTRQAVAEADVVLFLVDARAGVSAYTRYRKIFAAFGQALLTVPIIPGLNPALKNTASSMYVVEVFPFVPVTPITGISAETLP